MDAVLNTAFASDNLGDKIIHDALLKRFPIIGSHSYPVLEMNTHDGIGRASKRLLSQVERCFVTGGNSVPIKRVPWRRNIINLSSVDARRLKGTLIFVGAGTENYPGRLSVTASPFLKTALSNEYIHSTRDELTAQYLREVGHQAINTGCPTTWGLNGLRHQYSESEAVVCTINAAKAPSQSQELVKGLSDSFHKVFIWPQDYGDEIFAKKITEKLKSVSVLSRSVGAYDELLSKESSICSVNLRLHGGIRAMASGIYAKIYAVDNRAAEMLGDISYPVTEFSASRLIDFPSYELAIKIDNVKRFLAQF